ncbi:hypothetical protein N7447_005631, partial [Penicillium robsamsonii]|uniref:uncharacterized protein n=1 Tax=Penicillium robsamsonii TaxID=1792511 RepID=UPI0025492028
SLQSSIHEPSGRDGVWGYAHGPIPNNNPDWKLKLTTQHRYISKKRLIVALASNRSQAPMVTPIRIVVISWSKRLNCEERASTSRAPYPIMFVTTILVPCIVNPRKLGPVGIEEEIARSNAIKRWVLMGGWRDALYLKEPKRHTISATLIVYYCDALEEIARTDAQLAAEYGTQFHRSGYQYSSTTLEYYVDIIKRMTNLPGNRLMPLVAPSTPGSDDSVKSSRCEQPTQTEPTSDNDPDVNPDFTSGSGPDCNVVSIESEPGDRQ